MSDEPDYVLLQQMARSADPLERETALAELAKSLPSATSIDRLLGTGRPEDAALAEELVNKAWRAITPSSFGGGR